MSPEATARKPHTRRFLIDALFTAAVLVGVFAVLAVWVHRQVLNTDNWTKTSSQLLADPKIREAVGDVMVNELFNSVDVAGELKKVLPGEVSGLAGPAAAGLRQLAQQVAPDVLANSKVQEAWRLANRTAQIQLLRILNGGTKTITTSNGVVTLQLHTLVEDLAAQLGLAKQFASVQSKLQGSSGAAVRSAAQERLGVTIPPTSGGIVILRSSQLKTAQNIVKAVKGLSIVLPAIAIALLVLAVWLADGWRRVALRRAGWCLVAIGLIVLLLRRVASDEVVNSLVQVETNKPAAHDVLAIGTRLLYDIAIAMLTYGIVVAIAAWSAGPTRVARSLRHALAPTLRERVGRAYGAAALALLLVVIWGPFPSTRQLLPVIGMAALLALGVRTLQGMTATEFPDAQLGDTERSIRAWYAARRGHAGHAG
jgi:hypothetical protein